MADSKISALTAATGISGADYYPLVQDGETKRATVTVTESYFDTKYSTTGHSHTGVYSPTGHDHSGVYSPTGHDHTGVYQPVGSYLTAETDPIFAAASGNFAASDHNHDLAYLGIAAKAADADKLDGYDSLYFSTTGHDHAGIYSPTGHDHSGVYSPTGHNHAGTYQPVLTFGIADDNAVWIDDADAASGQFARFTTTGIEGYAATGVTYETIGLACSDETTDLTAASGVVTFRMPFAMTLMDIAGSVNTAPSGSNIAVDVNENGTSIFSTVLTIDSGEETSTTALTGFVLSDNALAKDSEISVDRDQVGSITAGKGLKVFLIGYRT